MNITVEGGKSKKLLTGGKYCPEDITVTAEAPVAVEEKDVNFYDYDGTCLYAYTIAEAQALTELPPLPSHEGLICQGWNWSLEDVKALDQLMAIGANYVTDDGKTRLYIKLEYEQHLTVPLYIRQSVSEGVEIDWGDGSAIETISGTGEVNTSHTYAQLGEYVIRLNAVSGQMGFGGSNRLSVVGADRPTILRKAELGNGITSKSIGTGANSFYGCRYLKTITTPKDIVVVTQYSFSGCYSLVAFIFPMAATPGEFAYWFDNAVSLEIVSFNKAIGRIFTAGMNGCYGLKYVALCRKTVSTSAIGDYALQNAYSVKRVEVPEAATAINTSAYANCRSLIEFTVYANVAKIGSSAWSNNYSMARLRFLPATPPTVANANAFSGIPTTCIVEVPAESLEAYQNATNYSGIAAQMVGV